MIKNIFLLFYCFYKIYVFCHTRYIIYYKMYIDCFTLTPLKERYKDIDIL